MRSQQGRNASTFVRYHTTPPIVKETIAWSVYNLRKVFNFQRSSLPALSHRNRKRKRSYWFHCHGSVPLNAPTYFGLILWIPELWAIKKMERRQIFSLSWLNWMEWDSFWINAIYAEEYFTKGKWNQSVKETKINSLKNDQCLSFYESESHLTLG